MVTVLNNHVVADRDGLQRTGSCPNGNVQNLPENRSWPPNEKLMAALLLHPQTGRKPGRPLLLHLEILSVLPVVPVQLLLVLLVLLRLLVSVLAPAPMLSLALVVLSHLDPNPRSANTQRGRSPTVRPWTFLSPLPKVAANFPSSNVLKSPSKCHPSRSANPLGPHRPTILQSRRIQPRT